MQLKPSVYTIYFPKKFPLDQRNISTGIMVVVIK